MLESIIIGFVIFVGGLAGGAAMVSKSEPKSAGAASGLFSSSEARECRALCGKDRVKSFDRIDGSCECYSKRESQ